MLEHTLHVNGRDAWYEKQSACDGQMNADNGGKRSLPHPPLKETESSVYPTGTKAIPASTLKMIDKE